MGVELRVAGCELEVRFWLSANVKHSMVDVHFFSPLK
jgi:hypothetical protein